MALDLLGTRAFLPTLLAQITNASPHPLPLDPVVLQSILLVLAAGQRKHLILNALDPEEVSIVARIAEWTLSNVFNLPTHRLKIKPPKSKSIDDGVINPAAFLRSIFLTPSSSSAEALHDERPPSSSSISKTVHGSSGHYRKQSYRHGTSSRTATTHSDPFSDIQVPPDSMASQPPSLHPKQFDPTPAGSSYSHHRAHARHSRSTPSQHSKSKSKSKVPPVTASATSPRIPAALVISGLEHASDISQRALVRVLAGGCVVLPKKMQVNEAQKHQSGDDEEEEMWDLPENFIVVYVTSWDLRERPAIHKSLLDKFAMSTNITIQPGTKHALRSISTGSTPNPFSPQPNPPHLHSLSNPSTPLSPLNPLSPHPQTLPSQSIPLPPGIPDNTYTSPPTNPFLPEHNRISSYRATQSLPRPRSVSPPSFTSATIPPPASDPADPLLHPTPRLSPEIGIATAVPNAGSPPTLTLPVTFLPYLRDTTARHTHISPSLNLYLQDLFTAARFDSPELEATLLTARAMEDAEMLARACRVLGTELRGWELIRGGEPSMKNEQEKNQEVGGDGEEDGSSGGPYGWEFETGYDPSGSVVIDIGIGDVNGRPDWLLSRQEPGINKHKGKEKRAEWPVGPLKVTFDEDESAGASTRSGKGTGLGVRILDVSEADVARIVPRVISHRVRMRDSWTDEVLAGAVCGAAFSADTDWEDMHKFQVRDGREDVGVTGSGQDDMTVKDILVRILQKV
ncbi:hypothetical protein AX15_007564 [Amanita polypyramis BW_CC]|nr:hypothetical protein AX15_007564 [Amanita polypyramis BW_CC]